MMLIYALIRLIWKSHCRPLKDSLLCKYTLTCIYAFLGSSHWVARAESVPEAKGSPEQVGLLQQLELLSQLRAGSIQQPHQQWEQADIPANYTACQVE